MSTYPRLPFRPVPLTLALRKPTHPPPISITHSPLHFPSSSSSFFSSCFSSSNNKMSLSSLLSPVPVLTALPNSPSSSSSASSTLPPTPTLSPCPPPRQFQGSRDHCVQGIREKERLPRQRYGQRAYVPHMVQQKKTAAEMPFKIAFQNDKNSGGGGKCFRRRSTKQSIITPFKPPISPRFSVISKNKKRPATVITAAAAVGTALALQSKGEDDIDLEALTYYPPVHVSGKEAETGGGLERGYSAKRERRRTKLNPKKKRRDRHRPEQPKPPPEPHHSLQRATHSDQNAPNKSHSALSRDSGQCIIKTDFSACDNQANSNNNRQGYFSRPNSAAPVATRRPRSSADGLPMPLKKRFMMKNSLI